ncbi:MAG TPA: hypothetical protein VFK50_08440 [Sphingomicrobium sp.]|nr:hypothetical protein [Sphingomicrobium sp.]
MISILIILAAVEDRARPDRADEVREKAKASVVIERAASVGEAEWKRTPPAQRREIVLTEPTGHRYTIRLIEFE